MKKYVSPITAHLTPDNWTDKIDLSGLSLDGMIDLFGDLKKMEKLAKAAGGYLKEAIKSRMPEGEDEYATPNFRVVLSERVRKGSLDEARILEEMGEEWVEDHRKPPTEYIQMNCNAITEEDA